MTVMTNVVLVLKDSEGNIGIVKSLTDNDINKISNAITDIGQVVDPATHMPIEATTASVGVVQLATAQDITNGTAGKVVDAQELNNFVQTLPAVNGVTDVSSGNNSNQLVVSRIGGSKTLTIDNVEHAGTAASADSVSWDNVSDKPSSYTPSSHTHDDRYYTESEIDTKLSGKANTSGTYSDLSVGYATSSNTANYANSTGNADTLDGYHHDSFPKINAALFTVNGLSAPGWSKIGTGDGGSCIQVKTTDNTYPSICFHRSGYSHCVLAESGGQLGTMSEGRTAFNRLLTTADLSNIFLRVYPVGSIYISASSTNPGTLFGGTWKALDQGRVLIGANSTYKAGTTGGEFTHTITTGEMPSHTHTGTTGNESAGHTHSGTTGNQSAGHTHSWSGTTSSDGSHAHTASSNSTGAHTHSLGGRVHSYKTEANNNASHLEHKNVYDFYEMGPDTTGSAGSHSHTITVNSNGAHTHTVSGTTGGISANHTHSFTTGGISAHHTHNFTTGASGSGSAMNNMQPYLAVYMWQRTA